MGQRKETKKIKARDLKPRKDAKGGLAPPCGPTGPKAQSGHGTTLPAVQRPVGNN